MSVHAVNLPHRRGACPGLSAPMATGDGLLVRLTPIGTIPLDVFAELCAAARQHGNGIIEITARGNIQVRGLNVASAPSFATRIATLDIAAADGVPVLSNPLAGLDPTEIIDAAALAADLRKTLARTSFAQRLSAKVSVVIDAGGSLDLDDVAADVRLCAVAIRGGAALRICLAGEGDNASPLGLVAPTDGIAAVVRLLEVVAQRGRHVRARDIVAQEGTAPFREAVAELPIGNTPALSVRRASEAIGVHRLRDSSLAYGVGLAFGHADAISLEKLSEAAKLAGANGLRAAPGRVLMAIGLEQQTLSSFVAAAEDLGFIVRTDDPRRHVVACAGAPICAAAEIPARAIGPAIAASAAAHLDGSFKIHVSGCAKGCAHPAPAALTIVGTPAGCGVVINGSARDTPLKIVAADSLPAEIAERTRVLAHEAGHV
jgi:precorrin-3B synthase